MSHRAAGRVSLTGVLFCLSQGAAAQDSGPSTDRALEEIVVTAQKRSENIQDVPIAVTAISGESLAKAGINDTKQLQIAIPTLNYSNDTGYAMPFLRGIGTSITQPGSEPSVATFIDGVYVAAQLGLVTNLLGTERVEVLAGPQGTLYGRNASGGAINITTLTPKQNLEGKATVTYGNYNRTQGSAYISGGLTDRLAVGVYLAGSRRETYLDFVPTTIPGQPTHEQATAGRAKAVWEPVDGIKLTGSIERDELKSVEGAYRNIQPDSFGILAGGSADIRRFHIYEDLPQWQKIRITLASLREEFDLGFADLVGISGYRNMSSPIQSELDGTDAPVLGVGSPLKSRQFSQEVQLLSKAGSPLSWIAGAYYFDERGGFRPLYVYSSMLFPGFNVQTLDAPEKTRSYAAFAQVTAPLSFITEGLSLTLGGRYTRDEKERELLTQNFLNNGLSVLPTVTYPALSKNWSKFTPKATLQYKFEESLLYATYATGFKSGMFNVSAPSDIGSVSPENLTDYEVGFKTDLLDRRLRLNLAAYYYDFKNLQVQVLDPAGGVSAVLRNAASAKAYGAELNAVAKLSENLILNVGAAWEHSEYTDFPNAPFFVVGPVNVQINGVSATGKELQRAPRFVSTVGADYTVPLADGSKIKFDGSFYHNSGFAWDPNHQLMQKSYNLVTVSAGYTLRDTGLTFSLWGTNLTNAYRGNAPQIASFGTITHDDEPRMYGITVTYQLP